MKVGIIGGTGKLGFAIAGRLARAGVEVLIGSRTQEASAAKAAELGHGYTGRTNLEAAAEADLVIVTVPFAAQMATLEQIALAVSGKIVVDTTVPLVPPKVMRVQLPPEGSAALCSLKALGEGVRLVTAFHNVAAHKLAEDDAILCDVLVFGDDKEARAEVIALIERMGLRGLHGGVLVNSVAAEALTSILILINKTYGVDGAGLQITGID